MLNKTEKLNFQNRTLQEITSENFLAFSHPNNRSWWSSGLPGADRARSWIPCSRKLRPITLAKSKCGRSTQTASISVSFTIFNPFQHCSALSKEIPTGASSAPRPAPPSKQSSTAFWSKTYAPIPSYRSRNHDRAVWPRLARSISTQSLMMNSTKTISGLPHSSTAPQASAATMVARQQNNKTTTDNERTNKEQQKSGETTNKQQQQTNNENEYVGQSNA